MIFQSLGSNYTLASALRLLTAHGRAADSQALISWLEARYGGIAYLYDKGRDGLAAVLDHLGAPNTAINGITCSVLVDAIKHASADICYLDIDPSGNFSLTALEQALASDSPPRVVIVQNTFGNPCDIAPIERLANSHKFIIIEDLAHCLGQCYADGREVGTVGDIVMLTFGRDKVVDVVNAGAIVIREPRLLNDFQPARKLRPPAAQWRDRVYPLLTWLVRRTYRIYLGRILARAMYRFYFAEHSADGGIHPSFTLPHWQAKCALRELTRLDANLAHRRALNQIYCDTFGEQVPATDALIRTPLIAPDRDRLLAELTLHHYYLSDIWYDVPIGPRRKYHAREYPEKQNRSAMKLTDQLINLPTHVNIRPAQARRLATVIQDFYDQTN